MGETNSEVDPLYPAVYDTVADISLAREEVDTCLTSVGLNGGYHRYHIVSPCIFDTKMQAADHQVSC